MKKRFLHFIPILLLICYSCNNENYDFKLKNNLTINEAKEWFYSNQKSGDSSSKAPANDSVTNPILFLDWELAFIENNSKWTAVELPWEYENMKTTAMLNETENYLLSNEIESKHLNKLVIIKHNETGDMYGFRMEVIPNLKYYTDNNINEIEKNTYLTKKSNFNGIVLFYNLKNEFVNGWAYTDGSVQYSIKMSNAQKINEAFKAKNISYYEITYCRYLKVGNDTWGWVIHEQGCHTARYYIEDNQDHSPAGGGSGGEYDFSGGGSGGSGGYGENNPNQNQTPTIEVKPDCNELANSNTNAIANILNSVYNDPYGGMFPYGTNRSIANAAPILKNYSNTHNYEWAMTASRDGNIHNVSMSNNDVLPFNTNLNKNQVTINHHRNTSLIFHTHPKGTLTTPSASDAIILYNIYNSYLTDNIFANIIFAHDGSEHAVYISDRNMFKNFCHNISNANFGNLNGTGFVNGTVFETDYSKVYNNLKSKGYSEDLANLYALTYVLDKHNTGIKIASRNNSSEDFREQSTEVNNVNSSEQFQPQRCP